MPNDAANFTSGGGLVEADVERKALGIAQLAPAFVGDVRR
jgi:hypothetical protein